ncbi:hypothetical protein H5410_056005, partial [Solanum commersonii]
VQQEQPNKQPNNMSMEEMLKKIMTDQTQLVADDIMSGTHRPSKEVATSSQRKRVRSGGMYLPHPQYQRAKPGGSGDNFACEFPQILRRIRELHMEFIFAEGRECNLQMVREFYANWEPDARSHFMTVRGVIVTITPAVLNDIMGTSPNAEPLVLTGLNVRPPYRAIRHTLCGPQAMVQWTKHSGKQYHQSLPYAHLLREARVWLKIMMHYLILGLHYTYINQDRVCLVYALMTAADVNIGAVLKSAIRKARVHKGRRSAFGGLITKLCHVAGVPEESMDYMTPLFPTPMDIMRTKGTDIKFGPILTTIKRNRRDKLFMARMYGLEMLRHQNSCLASTDM